MSDFKPLLPSNATQLELDLEQLARAAESFADPLRHLWDADSCPAQLLPWLAWSFSVDHWQTQWPEEFKRGAIRGAIDIHRKKGTRRAGGLALDALGVQVDVEEWWTFDGDPHTFRVNAYAQSFVAAGLPIDAEFRATVEEIVDTVKPVRAHFEVRIGEARTTRLRAAARTSAGGMLGSRRKVAIPVEAHEPAVLIGARHLGGNVTSHIHVFSVPEGAIA